MLGRYIIPVPHARHPGQVSLEDLEGAASSLAGVFGGAISVGRAVWVRNQAACLAAGGAIGLVYGGPFAFTVLFARAFAASGWPPLRSVLKRLAAAYQKAKALPPRETQARAGRAQTLRDELKTVQVRLKCCSPPMVYSCI